MFSLIVTIIAIALVAALALATIYYGGTAFNKGADSANASKVLTQGQQITGAMDLYRADFGVWPNSLSELVEKNYLTEIPVAYAPDNSMRAATVAFAQEVTGWEMPAPGVPVVVYNQGSISTEVCKEVNRKAIGHNGILKQAYPTYATQCFGSTDQALSIVLTRDPSALATALPAGDVATVAPPDVADTASTLWLIPPMTGGGSAPTPPAPPVAAEWLWKWDPTATTPKGNGAVTLSQTPLARSLYILGPGSRAFSLGQAEAYGWNGWNHLNSIVLPYDDESWTAANNGETPSTSDPLFIANFSTVSFSADPIVEPVGSEIQFRIGNVGLLYKGQEIYSGQVNVVRTQNTPQMCFHWNPFDSSVTGPINAVPCP